MSNSAFDAFVKKQQIEQEREAAFNPKQQLAEWLGYLDALYKQVEGYLQTYLQSEAAKITYRNVSINEEMLGDYSARELILKIGRATVTFSPVGTMLIGAKGRVDIQGPIGRARLVLIDKQATTARQLIRVTISHAGEPPPAPPSHEAIRQIEWTWKISTPPPEMKFIDLTQEAFFDIILAVANA